MPHSRNRLVARHVGMTVQGEARAGRHDRGRLMLQVKGVSCALEDKAFGDEAARIAISADGMERRTDGAQFAQNLRRADVAEVPDFIGFGQKRRQRGRQVVMGVGNDGDAHPPILEAARITRKP